MQRNIDAGLAELKQHLVRMAGLVEAAIEKVTLAWKQQSLERLKEVYEIENQVNAAHLQIDADCLRLLATQQPLAGELRLILATIKMNNDLERIVDQTVNIGHNLEHFVRAPDAHLDLTDLEKIASEVKTMVRGSIDAFVRQDEMLARSVIRSDDYVDDLKNSIFTETLARIKKDQDAVEQGLNIILIARNFERIGDHATNIAEDVIFSCSGEDIRHPGLNATKESK
ncbi:MAG: phosphate signaling complex protein PhoU [Deltaproteobacteria bacterium]|nr:phosphate signaling complex protein PhoU [Deltaproteobacteria bacterium]MBI3293882.1 phosphate signaling complex protein PhoU [Deltaproteobacteria bacterium]